jgi:hypothetical protein
MPTKKKTRLSLDLETLRALDQVQGGQAVQSRDRIVFGGLGTGPDHPIWQRNPLPLPPDAHSIQYSCGFICLYPRPRPPQGQRPRGRRKP